MNYAPQSHRRRGFTLIELLVVVAIVATLVGITIPAVQGARKRAQVAQAHNDITQLSNAIAAFKTTYQVEYMPDSFNTAEMSKIWPRLTTAGIPAASFYTDGSRALVYYLAGGDGLGNPSFTGFSTSSQTPYNTSPTVNRQAAFFDFPTTRINANNQFLDPWGNPYAYFTARNQQYTIPTTPPLPAPQIPPSVYPLKDSRGLWLNAHSFQIICSGADGVFGVPNLTNYQWNPGFENFAPNKPGADDLSNFNSGPLGTAQ